MTVQHRVPELPRAHLAEAQVRRESRSALERGTVACVAVVREPFAEECAHACRGTLLARCPGRMELRIPGNPRQQLPVLESLALDPAGRAWDGARLGERPGNLEGAQAVPEGREDAKRIAATGAKRRRLGQQRAGKRFEFGAQRGAQCGVRGLSSRVVGAIAEHARCARRLDQLPQHLLGRAPAQNELRRALRVVRRCAQRRGERKQAVVQPPAGRPAERAARAIIEDVDRNDGPPGLGGRRQRGIVAQAQVIAEPDDDGA